MLFQIKFVILGKIFFSFLEKGEYMHPKDSQKRSDDPEKGSEESRTHSENEDSEGGKRKRRRLHLHNVQDDLDAKKKEEEAFDQLSDEQKFRVLKDRQDELNKRLTEAEKELAAQQHQPGQHTHTPQAIAAAAGVEAGFATGIAQAGGGGPLVTAGSAALVKGVFVASGLEEQLQNAVDHLVEGNPHQPHFHVMPGPIIDPAAEPALQIEQPPAQIEQPAVQFEIESSDQETGSESESINEMGAGVMVVVDLFKEMWPSLKVTFTKEIEPNLKPYYPKVERFFGTYCYQYLDYYNRIPY